MKERDTNTEQIILEAAEHEFLRKGFAGAKTTAIAERAGVNHAMIHYYFRTKENLFNTVFQQKIQLLAGSVSASFDHDLPFFDQLRLAIETHFDFVAANPKVLFFIYSEIISNNKRKFMLYESVYPRFENLLASLKKGIDSEVKKGTIRPIQPIELLMNIIALNVITFLAQPLLEIQNERIDDINKILKERKESNVQFIVNGLRV